MGGEGGDKLIGGIGNNRAGWENGFGTGIAQRVKILRRNNPADNHHHIVFALCGQRVAPFRP